MFPSASSLAHRRQHNEHIIFDSGFGNRSLSLADRASLGARIVCA